MIVPSNRVRIVVATRPVDFRNGHDGLAAVVKRTLRRDPFTGTVFVFRAKRADRLRRSDSPGRSGQRSGGSGATNRAMPALAEIDLGTLTPDQAATVGALRAGIGVLEDRNAAQADRIRRLEHLIRSPATAPAIATAAASAGSICTSASTTTPGSPSARSCPTRRRRAPPPSSGPPSPTATASASPSKG